MIRSSLSLIDEARLRFPGRSDPELVERVAAEIIDDLDERPAVSLDVVASFRDIRTVLTEPLPFAGSLTPEPTGLVMRLNAADSSGRRRFTGFHEVGHTFQRGYRHQSVFRCGYRRLGAAGSADPEDLADMAAAELLMPARYFRGDLAAVEPGWDGISALADAYGASLHATALRAVRLAATSVLLVVLEPGYRKSEQPGTGAVPKLRVTGSWSSGPFPFIPSNKSAVATCALQRALTGEDVQEHSSLNDLGLDDDRQLNLFARSFPYTGTDGKVHPRVMALYRLEPRHF